MKRKKKGKKEDERDDVLKGIIYRRLPFGLGRHNKEEKVE